MDQGLSRTRMLASMGRMLLGWLAIVLAAGVAQAGAQGAPKPAAKPPLPGLQTGELPWPAELNHLNERLVAIGLPAMPNESFVLHIHQQLTITVRGQRVTVPSQIGIHELSGFISPIHTHNTTGTIHIEAPNTGPFTLGQFFDVWGLRLTARCIGGYCTAGPDSLKVLSNGVPVPGDPRALKLDDRQQIDITFGTPRRGPFR